jgi:tetratricopeptide (TPR) repeat protein
LTGVSTWPPTLARQAGLAEIEAELTAHPDSIRLRFERACILSELGRNQDAQHAYLDLLVRAPSHRAALNNFGTLLHSTGYRTAARTAYREAVAQHPDDPTGHVNLANLLLEEGEIEEAREHYEAALRLVPDHSQAHQGLGSLLIELGEPNAALEHQRMGYRDQAVIGLPYRGDATPIRVLMLISANGANVPIRHLLDDRVFQTTVLLPQFYASRAALPEHDVVFNAIGDADNSEDALEAAASLLLLSGAAIFNHPAAVLRTGRAENLLRLSRLPGVITAHSARVSRELLVAADAPATLAGLGFAFPLLLRTPGFHNGRNFIKVSGEAELPGCLASIPGEELIVLQFLDSRAVDGKVRKYRVMLIDGRLYPLHLAISSNWKIHYVTAEMSGSAVHRAEEAQFLEDMPGVLGPRAMAALDYVQRELALDYAGIDFGLSPHGDVLLFEANATMVVHMPEPEERWSYRRSAVERIQEAVRDMLTTPPRRSAKLPM